MTEALDQLRRLAGKVFDLAAAVSVLSWDQQTYMPPGSSEGRAQALSTLSSSAHEMFISDEFGSVLEAAENATAERDPEASEALMVRRLRRDFEKSRRVPAEWVAESSREIALAFNAWNKARPASDFKSFEPHLVRVLDHKKQYVEFFSPYNHPYDPLLNDYEPGMKTATVREIFRELRDEQVPLVEAISEKADRVDNSFLKQAFDEQKQWDFSLQVVRELGYDFERGRQDKAPHPFSTSFNKDDVRITSRVYPNSFGEALFGSVHEAGHGMYSQGLAGDLDRIPALSGSTVESSHHASLGIHESQSRMMENLVGRSRNFWNAYYPTLQKVFPSQLGEIDVDSFYRGINKVQRSLIRVDADEATYNLHVMLRFEIEFGLIEGDLEVPDLPEIWNAKYEEYLGITPPEDRLGVLQDIHWAIGLIGYFPTYALGNLIASQLWEKLGSDIPNLGEQIAAGQFGDLVAWLREKVHRYGGNYEPMVLLERITGEGLSAKPYLKYLKDKYSEIYDLG